MIPLCISATKSVILDLLRVTMRERYVSSANYTAIRSQVMYVFGLKKKNNKKFQRANATAIRVCCK